MRVLEEREPMTRAMRVSPDIESTSPDELRHQDDAHTRLADAEATDSLWRIARETLSDEQLAALWLFSVEDMSAPEIAKVLGRSWVSVKTMLHRARRRLQSELKLDFAHQHDEVTHDRPIPLDGR